MSRERFNEDTDDLNTVLDNCSSYGDEPIDLETDQLAFDNDERA